jgi:hypothetical protein
MSAKSGAKVTAVQTLTRRPRVFLLRGAFGLRRVHRRFRPPYPRPAIKPPIVYEPRNPEKFFADFAAHYGNNPQRMAERNLKSKIRNPKSNQLVPRLLNWFAANARDLPWRRTRDPYSIWVSEIIS